ncbi:CocE/NonD family hydrolase [Kitasatospora indigofera]|uniref:CocE/NonD family hydrolase n=1 Tax=Kitasatospora indigofera TaxID=67307 RepID=UPI003647424A
MRSLPTRLLGVAVAGALLVTLGATATATAVQPPLIANAETQPIYGMADAIRLTVNITTPVDTDNDGKNDTVQLRLKRPATAAGVKVPTIIEPSPYNMLTDDRLPHHDFTLEGDGTSISTLFPDSYTNIFGFNAFGDDPEEGDLGIVSPGTGLRERKTDVWDMTYESWFDNYFVPRGYAVADLDALGTGHSTGCPGLGSKAEQAGVKAAVDWLNGRTTGVDATTNKSVTATDWSSGNVALKGKSYDGALSIEGAASGVAGLKTVVSSAGFADWYTYTRDNGAVVGPGGGDPGYDLDNLATYVNTGPSREACKAIITSTLTDKLDRSTGDRNSFWDERNYASPTAIANTKASVFLLQGTRDNIVRPEGTLSYWDALQAKGVPSKMWVFQADHKRAYNLRRDEYVLQMHHWYDHWLYNIDNGIMNEKKVDVQQSDLTTWSTQDTWPASGTTGVKLALHADGTLSTGAKGASTDQSITDTGATTTPEAAMSGNGASNANSLAYLTPALNQPLTLEGAPSFSIKAKLNGVSPYLTAMLVDYGPQSYGFYDGDDTDPTHTLCDGTADGTNTGCSAPYKKFTRGVSLAHPNFRVISRGWLDSRNNQFGDRKEFWVIDNLSYTFNWTGQPTNYTVPAGHQLGIVLVSTDKIYTPHYVGTSGTATTTLTATTESSTVTLPVKSGQQALQ